MNEKNAKQSQKPRTSKLAKASIICLGLIFVSIILGTYLSPFLANVKHHPRGWRCSNNIRHLCLALHTYAIAEFDGKLLTVEPWCDVLITKDYLGKGDAVLELFVCPYSDTKEGQSSYALNKNLAGFKISDDLKFEGIPDPEDVVLLFETKPGWNQVGGPELLTVDNHEGDGCIICFVDGHAEFVSAEDIDTLHWKP